MNGKCWSFFFLRAVKYLIWSCKITGSKNCCRFPERVTWKWGSYILYVNRLTFWHIYKYSYIWHLVFLFFVLCICILSKYSAIQCKKDCTSALVTKAASVGGSVTCDDDSTACSFIIYLFSYLFLCIY